LESHERSPQNEKIYEEYWRKVANGGFGFDLGSGDGRMVIMLALLNTEMEWTGVEVQEEAHADAERLLALVRTIVPDVKVTLVCECLSTYTPPLCYVGRRDGVYFANNFLFDKYAFTKGPNKNSNLNSLLVIKLCSVFPPGRYIATGPLYDHNRPQLCPSNDDFKILFQEQGEQCDAMGSTFNEDGLTVHHYEAVVAKTRAAIELQQASEAAAAFEKSRFSLMYDHAFT